MIMLPHSKAAFTTHTHPLSTLQPLSFQISLSLCDFFPSYHLPPVVPKPSSHPLMASSSLTDAELSSESSSDSSSSESDGTSSSEESSSDQEDHHHQNCAVSHT